MKAVIYKKLLDRSYIQEGNDIIIYSFLLAKSFMKLDCIWDNDSDFSINMENCDVMLSVNVALSISTFLRNIGIEDKILFNSFSMPYDDTHVFSGTYEDYCKDSLYGEFIPIREEIRKENNINYYFEIPKSWNFTNKNSEITRIDKGNLSRKRDTVHFIDVHTRKIKGKASDTAEEIAKKYFLKVGKGITVVKPHLRTY